MPVIPVNRMMVLWKSDPNGRINELLVVDIDDKKPGLEEYPASAGACDDGWLGGSPIATPLGLFAQLGALYGFSDYNAGLAAAEQFANVADQSWASEIVDRESA